MRLGSSAFLALIPALVSVAALSDFDIGEGCGRATLNTVVDKYDLGCPGADGECLCGNTTALNFIYCLVSLNCDESDQNTAVDYGFSYCLTYDLDRNVPSNGDAPLNATCAQISTPVSSTASSSLTAYPSPTRPSLSDNTLGSSSGSSSGFGSSGRKTSGLSIGAKAGIGVGVGLGVPLLIAGIGFFVLVLRRRRTTDNSQQYTAEPKPPAMNSTQNSHPDLQSHEQQSQVYPSQQPYNFSPYPQGPNPINIPQQQYNHSPYPEQGSYTDGPYSTNYPPR